MKKSNKEINRVKRIDRKYLSVDWRQKRAHRSNNSKH